MRISIFRAKTQDQPEPTEAKPRPSAGLDLEGTLLDLAKWGSPMMFQSDGGEWTCMLQVNVTPLGAKFEVSSGRCALPMTAALECKDRLQKAVACIDREAQ